VSIGLHAGIGLAIASAPVLLESLGAHPARLFNPSRPRDPKQPPPPEQVPPEPKIRPGIEASDSNSVTWIGFAEATEQSAPLSSVDQSGMTTKPAGAPADPMPPGDPAAADESQENKTAHAAAKEPEKVAAPSADAGPAPEVIAADTKVNPGQVNRGDTEDPARPAPPQPADPKADSPPPDAAPVQPPKPVDQEEVPPSKVESPEAKPVETESKPPPPVAEGPADAKPSPTGKPDQEPVKDAGVPGPLPVQEDKGEKAETKPAPPQPARSGPRINPLVKPRVAQPRGVAPRKPGKPAEEADKDADAMSVQKAVDYVNGRVKAGQGLDIKTVPPEFSTFIQVTAAPRNPVVELAFDRRGVVVSVRFLIQSGYSDVDEPIRDALWAWTAKGKEIADLANKPAGSVVKMSFKILLHS
jgi:hypothetical protein